MSVWYRNVRYVKAAEMGRLDGQGLQGTGEDWFFWLGRIFRRYWLLSEPYRTTFQLFLCFLAVSWDVITWLLLYWGLEFNSVLHKITAGWVCYFYYMTPGRLSRRKSSLRFPLMALYLFTWYHYKMSCRRESPRREFTPVVVPGRKFHSGTKSRNIIM